MKKKQIYSLLKNPSLAIVGILSTKMFSWLSDEAFLSIVYRLRIGKKLNLKNPTGFNEKLQWLKLCDRKPEYVTYVDKYACREHIAKTIGEAYLIPLVGVWNNADEIDFDSLPQKCVLKCTHDSGGVVIFEKGKTNIELAKKKINMSLGTDYYLRGREWPYKNVKRKVIGECFMRDGDGSKGLIDYKFMCFHGVPEMVMVCTDRDEMGVKVTFLDMNWNRLPFERHYSSDPSELIRPDRFDEMKEIAAKLSANIPFVRVDLYEINGQVYFGELTLYPGCGFEEFRPDQWDEKTGNLIDLAKLKRSN